MALAVVWARVRVEAAHATEIVTNLRRFMWGSVRRITYQGWKGRRARTELRPPNAREFERASFGAAWRGFSRMMSRLIVGSTSVTQALGGRRFSWRARTVARASSAPLAPMEWPWRALVELTGMWGA